MAAEFTVSLKDQISPSASNAEKQIQLLEKAMTALEARSVKLAALGDVKGMQKADQQFSSLGTQVNLLKDEFPGVTAGADAAGGGLANLGGGIASMINPATIAIGVITALAAAAVAAAVKLGELAMKGIELGLSMGEAEQKMRATMGVLAGSPAAGAKTIAMLDDLRASTGLTRDELADMAKKLMAVGIQGDALKGQLTALATIQAINPEGVQVYTEVLEKLQEGVVPADKALVRLQAAGVPVSEIAKQLGLKDIPALQKALKAGTISAAEFQSALEKAVTAGGAGALAVQANSISSLWARLQENLSHLFDGIADSPEMKAFTDALKDLFSVFDSGSASGKAMHDGITSALKGILRVATAVLPYVKKGIEYLVIGFLKLTIFVKQHWSVIKPILIGLAIAIGVMVVGAVVALAIVLGVLAMAALIVALPFIALGLVLYGIYKGITWLGGKLMELGAWLLDLGKKGWEAAKGLISGLVDGIKNGAGMVWDAVKSMATGAIDAIKSIFGIHSPSTLFRSFGTNVGAGLAAGLDGSTIAVGNASQNMGAAAVHGAVAGAAAPMRGANDNAKGGKGGGVTVHFDAGSIVVQGTAQQSASEISEQTMTLAWERLALTQGLGR